MSENGNLPYAKIESWSLAFDVLGQIIFVFYVKLAFDKKLPKTEIWEILEFAVSFLEGAVKAVVLVHDQGVDAREATEAYISLD